MMWRAAIILVIASPVLAESVVATRTIRAQTVIGPDDITLVDARLDGAIGDPVAVIGQEARVAIYAGRAVRAADLGPPTLIQRNQVVALIYLAGGLAISTEGRALSRGSEGDVIRVINLASRTTVSGRIGPNGDVFVGLDQ